jgi:deazaflavin-dependent oxidoreductase (nitroreductase family)
VRVSPGLIFAGVDGRRESVLTYDRVMHAVLATTTWAHRGLHRVSGGRLGRRFPGGATVLWLTVPGRRSGTPRTTPLLSARDDRTGAWIVAGSNAGQSASPAWVHNARAAATGQAEVAGAQYRVRIEEVTDPDEHRRCYAQLVGVWRWFAGYAQRLATTRDIPVFRLHPLVEPRQDDGSDGPGDSSRQ